MADYEWCLIIAAGMLAIVFLCEWAASKMPKDTCHCDDSRQGRECKPRNCTPPHLPRNQHD